jgi:hypothetical protein
MNERAPDLSRLDRHREYMRGKRAEARAETQRVGEAMDAMKSYKPQFCYPGDIAMLFAEASRVPAQSVKAARYLGQDD